MRVLGISLGHDTNFAEVVDGKVMAVMEAERYYRQKRYKLHCLDLNPGRKVSGYQYIDVAELGFTLELLGAKWGKSFDAVAVQNQGRQEEYSNLLEILRRYNFTYKDSYQLNHHLCHAALAYYTSPFKDALILSFDGFGNDGYTVLFKGNGSLSYLKNEDIRFGQGYNNLGYMIGISPDIAGSTAGKTMGLAAYGNLRNEWLPQARKYVRQYRKLTQKKVEGLVNFGKGHRINSVGLSDIADLRQFVRMVEAPATENIWEKSMTLLALKKTIPELALAGPEDKNAQDLMKTVQFAWTEAVLELLAKYKVNSRNLCLVGGCALNGITNFAVQESGMFENIHFVPNPSDCGLATGAALYVDHGYGEVPFQGYGEYFSPYLGEEPFDIQDLPALKKQFPCKELDVDQVPRIVADYVYRDYIVGVIRGRYEIGPRALGNRSILSNPLNKNARDIINQKVKHREWYRPFAPVVTAEDSAKYFTNVSEIPYMSVICHTRKEYADKLPSITHVDGSARVQTIRRAQNVFLYDTLKEFEKLSGMPVLLNTSFNPKGEPILNFCSVGLEMLNSTEMDMILIGTTLFCKKGKEELLKLCP